MDSELQNRSSEWNQSCRAEFNSPMKTYLVIHVCGQTGSSHTGGALGARWAKFLAAHPEYSPVPGR